MGLEGINNILRHLETVEKELVEELLHVSKENMNAAMGTLKYLETEGLIEETSPKGRHKRFTLTERGEKYVKNNSLDGV